jgi:hypothetical protein
VLDVEVTLARAFPSPPPYGGTKVKPAPSPAHVLRTNSSVTGG